MKRYNLAFKEEKLEKKYLESRDWYFRLASKFLINSMLVISLASHILQSEKEIFNEFSVFSLVIVLTAFFSFALQEIKSKFVQSKLTIIQNLLWTLSFCLIKKISEEALSQN